MTEGITVNDKFICVMIEGKRGYGMSLCYMKMMLQEYFKQKV